MNSLFVTQMPLYPRRSGSQHVPLTRFRAMIRVVTDTRGNRGETDDPSERKSPAPHFWLADFFPYKVNYKHTVRKALERFSPGHVPYLLDQLSQQASPIEMNLHLSKPPPPTYTSSDLSMRHSGKIRRNIPRPYQLGVSALMFHAGPSAVLFVNWTAYSSSDFPFIENRWSSAGVHSLDTAAHR